MGSIFNGDTQRAREIEQRGTQFEMRTNMKARPGSQGTLFQGGKPTAQNRWVRGYSPTRMAQTTERLGGSGNHSKISPDLDSEQNDYDFHPHFNPESMQHTRRLVAEPIARSTMDTQDLHELGSLTLSNASTLHTRKGPVRSPLGLHRAYGNPLTNEIEHRTITMYPHPDGPTHREAIAYADSSLIHELGHLHDSIRDPANFMRQKTGTAEEYADRFMMEHYRNDPRNQRRTKFDVGTNTYAGKGHNVSGYSDPRPALREAATLSPSQFHQGELF